MTEIYYKSEFELIETFTDAAGEAIDLTAINFNLKYYTIGNAYFIASKTGTTFLNCEIDSEETNKLHVFFKNHGLPSGTLQREISLYLPNSDFGTHQKIMINPISEIELVLKGGDQETAEALTVLPVIMPEPTFYDIKDLEDSTNLRATWSGKQNALGFTPENVSNKKTTINNSTTEYPSSSAVYLELSGKQAALGFTPEDVANKDGDIETNKTSTTKYPHIKAMYDWVKGLVNIKADITPSTGATSALRALFIARGYDGTTYHCVYNSTTGFYEMNGLTDITESQMIVIYNDTSQTLNNRDLTFALMGKTFRTAFKSFSSKYFPKYSYADCFTDNINLEVLDGEFVSLSFQLMCRGCSNLHTAKRINCDVSTNNTNVFYMCVKLVNAEVYLLKTNFSFSYSPLLSLASLQYLVTNRANATTRITITVHPTVWAKLNDAVNYPTWNALLVDAVANKYIDFASA